MTSPFAAFSISEPLARVLEELGFEKPTPIQARAWPVLLQGRDLVAQSATGSGKTLAFALPILQRLRPGARSPQALVLCPTRELCTQVAGEFRKLGRRMPGLQALVVSGGSPIFRQIDALERGVHLVVGTPGRILDHLERGTLDLRGVSTLVLDEADRMLDMGFEKDMRRILSALPESRQTALFSATYPSTIGALSREYQRSPERITVESETQDAPGAEGARPAVRQLAYVAPPGDEARVEVLVSLLAAQAPESALVFCNFKATVADLARELSRRGISAAGLSGDLEQADRDRVMAKFRNRSTRVLVATDVAARGIDVADLELVVNFELSPDPEIYVHRVGRTGRAGKSGLAVTLIHEKEKDKLARIARETGNAVEAGEPLPPAPKTLALEARMATLFIGAGRKDKLRPGDVLGALTGEAGGLPGSEIGKIEIHDRFAYVAVTATMAALAHQRLNDGRIKGRKLRVERMR